MFSVCVPVFNEQNQIERIADNIRGSGVWKESHQKELLFCVNGSSDRSEEIARHLAMSDPHIKVIAVPKKGKNNAWMRLVAEANPLSNALFFVDADVALESKTLSRLQDALRENPRLAIAAANTLPFRETGPLNFRRRAWQKALYNTPERHERSLSGQCYAIRAKDARDVRMPVDERIADDAYLNALFLDRLCKVPDARCLFRLPNLRDSIRQRTRSLVSYELLRRQYPHLAENLAASMPKPHNLRKMLAGLTVAERFAYALIRFRPGSQRSRRGALSRKERTPGRRP
jgi:glycosyltransferase involved in cell wall biosynthesis